jgi:hypothetical protein
MSKIKNNQVSNDFDIKGTVTNITNIEDGIVMLVENKTGDKTGMDKASVTVNKTTVITREGIYSFVAFDYKEIKVGDIVEVKFKGEILTTYPAQGLAQSVNIK